MNSVTFLYRYRLTDSCKADRMQVAGVTLTKDWVDFNSNKKELEVFIKNAVNTEGIIDYEKVNPFKKEKVAESTYTGEIPDIIPRETLGVMERFEIVPIAKYYNINPVNKNNKSLIKLILQAQTEREAKEDQRIKEEMKVKILKVKEESDNV